MNRSLIVTPIKVYIDVKGLTVTGPEAVIGRRGRMTIAGIGIVNDAYSPLSFQVEASFPKYYEGWWGPNVLTRNPFKKLKLRLDRGQMKMLTLVVCCPVSYCHTSTITLKITP